MGPRNQVLDGVPDSLFRRGNFEGEDVADCKVVQKWLNRLKCCLGLGLDGPKESDIRRRPDSPMGRGNFEGRGIPRHAR